LAAGDLTPGAKRDPYRETKKIMKQEMIIHNSISIDGSLTGFMPDMALHYKIAGDYHPQAHLIGADTVITGQEMFGQGIPEEMPSDLERPQRPENLPTGSSSIPAAGSKVPSIPAADSNTAGM